MKEDGVCVSSSLYFLAPLTDLHDVIQVFWLVSLKLLRKNGIFASISERDKGTRKGNFPFK